MIHKKIALFFSMVMFSISAFSSDIDVLQKVLASPKVKAKIGPSKLESLKSSLAKKSKKEKQYMSLELKPLKKAYFFQTIHQQHTL